MAITLDRAQVIEKLCELAAEQVGAEASQVTLDTHLYNDLNYDSLDLVEFAMTIEEEFEVDIPDERAQRVKTVGQALEALESIMA